MTSALATIEEIYSMVLNPEHDYYAQLEPLAANGELANHNSSMKVLFRLAMIVDEQAKQIKALEKSVDNLKIPPIGQPSLAETKPIVSDPTQPLAPIVSPDEQTTPTAEPNTDSTL